MPDPAPTSIPAPATATQEAPAGGPPRKKKLSLREALTDGNAGYKKLWPYVDKYRRRFVLSIIAGAGSAILTAGQAQVIRFVTKQCFREASTTEAAKDTFLTHGYFMDMTFHRWSDTAAVKVVPVIGHVLLICSW
jgi:hypothetical protein